MTIYYAKRHIGHVKVDGIDQFMAIHADDKMDYVVRFITDSNGLAQVNAKGDALQTEVIRGRVVFEGIRRT